MKQIMESYTEEDVNVWNILFTRQIKNLEDKACKEYLFYLKELTPVLHANAIPNLNEFSDLLFEKAGWRIKKSEKFTNPVKKFGFRPILRYFTPRYYLIYAERV